MKNLILFMIIGACFVFGSDKKLMVVASGETHAMLNACDCQIDPGGGFAKRSSLVKSLRDSADVLLVDAGGFAGGGMYDSYTEGRHNDSLRTIAALRAMGYLKYDAVFIGDDDLQYGASWLVKQAADNNVPLVCANCAFANKTTVVKPYILVKRGRFTFAITGVVTAESLIDGADSSISIKPIMPYLKAIWPEMVSKSDYRIILCHAGEAVSRQLLDSFPECNCAVNGHRKTTVDQFVSLRGQVMLQFGFQGKGLSYATIGLVNKSPVVQKTGWLTVGAALPDDPKVVSLVNMTTVDDLRSRQLVCDLYIMSQCQFGCNALREFTSFVNKFPAVQWQIWFIGSVAPDSSLSSLHGTQEVNDELFWLAVKALYPEKWFEFLQKRSVSIKNTSDAIARDMNLDLGKLKRWVDKNGMAELRNQYNRSIRMGINASPTLLVNNVVYQNEVDEYHMSRFACGQGTGAAALCDSLPECASDADCRMKGKTGACVSHAGKKAVCEFHDALKFTLTVVLPDSSLSHPEKQAMQNIVESFPGVVVDTVFAESKRGIAILKEYDPQFLPYFLFDTTVRNTPNFSLFQNVVTPAKNKLTFAQGVVKPAFFYKREYKPYAVTCHVDPLFPGARDAIRLVLAQHPKSTVIKIMPLLYENPDSAEQSPEESMRQEESLRWLVIAKRYPDKMNTYLARYLDRKNMSYWFTDCKAIGIDVDSLVAQVRADAGFLGAYWRDIEMLGMRDPVEVLVGNREVVAVKNPKEFSDLLTRIVR